MRTCSPPGSTVTVGTRPPSGAEGDEALVADPEALERLVARRLDGLVVDGPAELRRRVEVGVARGPRVDHGGAEVRPGHRLGRAEAGRGAEPRVVPPPHVHQLVVAVQLLAGPGREVVLTYRTDSHGQLLTGSLSGAASSTGAGFGSCHAAQLVASGEPRYSPLSPSCRPYQARTSGTVGPPQLPW